MISRLKALLGIRPSPSTSPAAQQAEASRVRRSLQGWKAKATALAVRGDARERALQSARAEIETMRARVVAMKRDSPSPALLGQVFLHRWRTFGPRNQPLSPPERERRFLDVSAAYRQVRQNGTAGYQAEHTCLELNGLTWWIPAGDVARDDSTGAASKQRLPFRGILQTREFSVGGVMLDIGANIGRMAIPRVILGDVTAAYCAEPDPVSYACLAANVIDNGLAGLVMPDRTAIGDRIGSVFLRRVGGSGGFHVVPGPLSDTIEVPCTTLDAWVSGLGLDPDAITFIKVDVEGFERRLLAGAGDVRAHRHIAWQMEIKPASLRHNGDEAGELYSELARSFSHFIDLNRDASGARVRPVGELGSALDYIEPSGKTDIILFNE